MRSFLTILLIAAIAVVAIGAFLYFTTPRSGGMVRFPPGEEQLALLERVPASADSFALIPRAPQLYARLEANPVTRDVVAQWAAEQQLPGPWLLGGADLVVWKRDKKTSYALRVDPFRAFLIRAWLMWSTSLDARWDGRMFVINSAPERTLTRSELEPILRLAQGLPDGNVLIVQRESARGAYPPMSRPAVTSVKVTGDEITLVSHARSGDGTRDAGGSSAAATQSRGFPRGAILAMTFAEPPRILGDLKRILRADIATAVSGGGTIALYDVDTGTLLPRPDGVIAVPATDERRAAMSDVVQAAELIGETRDTGTELLVSFDRNSVGHYLKDGFVPGTWTADRWALRMDPRRFVPILERLGDNTGLRLAAPRIHRAARDLRRWVRNLEAAQVIEAADSASGGVEELRVRIATK